MEQTTQPAAVDAKWHPQERYAFLYLPLLALLVTIVVELFNHKSFTDGPAGFWRFMTEEPLAFLVNFLIVLLTLVPAFFLRRRVFWCALVAFLWLVCGGVNGFILLNRMTPFTVADLTVFETGLDTVPNYLSTGYIILLVSALAAVAILLLGYGYWEQQGLFRPEYEEIQDKWYQDEAFMNEVEAAAGDGAMLFTLPYMKNFENGSLNNMWDYTLLRGPLHSKTLKFTYGAGYGTKNDLWYRETSELEPDAMVAELRTQGMTGIYLDLDGYPEDEQQSALAALTEAAGCGPEDVIHSGSGLLCYIPLGQE